MNTASKKTESVSKSAKIATIGAVVSALSSIVSLVSNYYIVGLLEAPKLSIIENRNQPAIFLPTLPIDIVNAVSENSDLSRRLRESVDGYDKNCMNWIDSEPLTIDCAKHVDDTIRAVQARLKAHLQDLTYTKKSPELIQQEADIISKLRPAIEKEIKEDKQVRSGEVVFHACIKNDGGRDAVVDSDGKVHFDYGDVIVVSAKPLDVKGHSFVCTDLLLNEKVSSSAALVALRKAVMEGRPDKYQLIMTAMGKPIPISFSNLLP